LLALMLLQESRRSARTDRQGDIVLFEQQDRTLWDQEIIREGQQLIEQLARHSPLWRLYGPSGDRRGSRDGSERRDDRLASNCRSVRRAASALHPSPVVQLNRAVAVAMRDGPAAGLPLIDALLAPGQLDRYHLAHAARADLCRRLGQFEQARAAYQSALALAVQEPERRFLAKRLAERSDPPSDSENSTHSWS
jgi:RNA polymerase sigma-70 factor (ECF subfamily)